MAEGEKPASERVAGNESDSEIVELDVGLGSLAAWRALTEAHPFTWDARAVERIVEHARRCGIVSPHLGAIAPEAIDVAGPNYREQFKACGLNARARAILDHFAQMDIAKDTFGARIFAPEAMTPFALRLRGLYPRFLGTEYLPDAAARERSFPIPHQDLEALSLPDGSFDLVLCNDVFEHVPHLERALSELARILREGGTMLSTFPFAYNQDDTIVKARLVDGRAEVIGEPEYHFDPLNPDGALVYQIPGWEILDIVRSAGFAHAEMRFVSSRLQGLCATELAGIFYLKAVR